jgi:hypothetical protein
MALEFKVGDTIQYNLLGTKRFLAYVVNERYDLLWQIGTINRWSTLERFKKTNRKLNIRKALKRGLNTGHIDNLTYIEILAQLREHERTQPQ